MKVIAKAKPSINPSYSLPQDAFPLKIIARKNGQAFKEIEIIIMVNAN